MWKKLMGLNIYIYIFFTCFSRRVGKGQERSRDRCVGKSMYVAWNERERESERAREGEKPDSR